MTCGITVVPAVTILLAVPVLLMDFLISVIILGNCSGPQMVVLSLEKIAGTLGTVKDLNRN